MGRGPTKKYHKRINENYVEGTLTCLKTDTIQKRITVDFPLVLNIEPTNACNLRCSFCMREETTRRQGINFLSLETFKRLIDEAVEYGPLIMLNLHKDGEPLLHKRLPEMVSYANKKKVAETIHLNTNGVLLDTRIGRRLLESGIDDITISVDAAFPKTYLKLKRSRKFSSLNRGIDSFLRYRDKIGAKTKIRVKIMEFDQVGDDEISAFHHRWESVADQVQVTGVHNWSGAIPGLSVSDETSIERFPCVLLWYALAVNCNGKVSICNVDWNYSGVVGNIYDKSIHDIWRDLPIRKVRQAQLNSDWGIVPVCIECVVWAGLENLTDFLDKERAFL